MKRSFKQLQVDLRHFYALASSQQVLGELASESLAPVALAPGALVIGRGLTYQTVADFGIPGYCCFAFKDCRLDHVHLDFESCYRSTHIASTSLQHFVNHGVRNYSLAFCFAETFGQKHPRQFDLIQSSKKQH